MNNNDLIKQLFEIRDKAVQRHDFALFESTQLDSYGGNAEHFLELKSMQTEVLYSYAEPNQPERMFALVKENYVSDKRTPYSNIAVYILIQTVKQEWKIYRLTYIY
jgi:hypothetical protein